MPRADEPIDTSRHQLLRGVLRWLGAILLVYTIATWLARQLYRVDVLAAVTAGQWSFAMLAAAALVLRLLWLLVLPAAAAAWLAGRLTAWGLARRRQRQSRNRGEPSRGFFWGGTAAHDKRGAVVIMAWGPR